MHQVRPSVEVIEKLLADGSPASLTYAALECRLAIEMICYERLRNAHGLISHADLRKWQPRDIVNHLMNEVDDRTTESFTISVAQGAPETEDAAGYKKMDWVPLGSQVGFNAKKLGGLWNALSNVALHMRLPRSEVDFLSIYGDSAKIRDKVTEALEEVRRISQGELISSGWGEQVTFTCLCGSQNSRRLKFLAEGKVISCINPACVETYACEMKEGEFLFERRVLRVSCECGSGIGIARNSVEKLRLGEHYDAQCENCGAQVVFEWHMMMGRDSRDG